MSRRAHSAYARVLTGMGLALVLTACGVQMRTTQIGRAHRPLPHDAAIQVSSVGMPQCPFEEVALVTIMESLDVRGEAMIWALEDEARRLGGHAIVGLRQVWFDEDDDHQGLSGTVIHYTDPDCRY